MDDENWSQEKNCNAKFLSFNSLEVQWQKLQFLKVEENYPKLKKDGKLNSTIWHVRKSLIRLWMSWNTQFKVALQYVIIDGKF